MRLACVSVCLWAVISTANISFTSAKHTHKHAHISVCFSADHAPCGHLKVLFHANFELIIFSGFALAGVCGRKRGRKSGETRTRRWKLLGILMRSLSAAMWRLCRTLKLAFSHKEWIVIQMEIGRAYAKPAKMWQKLGQSILSCLPVVWFCHPPSPPPTFFLSLCRTSGGHLINLS